MRHAWPEDHVVYETVARAGLSDGQVALVSVKTAAPNFPQAEVGSVLMALLLLSSVDIEVPLCQGGVPGVRIPFFHDN